MRRIRDAVRRKYFTFAFANGRTVTLENTNELLGAMPECDGMKTGYELRITRAVADAVDVPVVASGGAGQLEHLYEAIVEGHAHAVLCASIFHYGTHTVPEAKRFLAERGIPIRL